MSTTLLDELRAKTRLVADREAPSAAGLDRRHGKPIEPGDLIAFSGDGRLAVEWAVIAEESESGALVLVPADTDPALGSADVAAPAAAGLGPLRLRCAAAVRLDRTRLEAARRCGRIGPELRQAAERRLEALAAGTVRTSDRQHEVDRDPEYVDWLEDLRAEAAALAGPLGEREGDPPATLVRQSRRRLQLTLAAAILLAAALATSNVYWYTTLREASQAEVGLQSPPVLTNLPTLFLLPQETVRGGAEPLVVPPDAELLLLVLEVETPAPDAVYDLEAIELTSGRSVLSLEGLRRSGTMEIALALPPDRLAPGDYELLLARRGGAGPPLRYTLAIESGAAQRQSP